MKWLIASDLHLTDRPRDAYRFGIFQWMAEQQRKFKPDATFILGDITEQKDNHPSRLVNRVVDELMLMRSPVYILRGNHDGNDPSNPFFRFINRINGVHFIVEPAKISAGLYMIPHQRSQADFNAACASLKIDPLSVLMVHQTFDGSSSESGRHLTGLSTSQVELMRPRRVYAGDVHKPQQCGPVTYVGAPYHVDFGDAYTPRVLFVDNLNEQDLHFECPRKWSLILTSPDDLRRDQNLRKGDQVKIDVRLTKDEVVNWVSIRDRCLDACADIGLAVFGINLKVIESQRPTKKTVGAAPAADVLTDYCKVEGVGPTIRDIGLDLLRE